MRREHLEAYLRRNQASRSYQRAFPKDMNELSSMIGLKHLVMADTHAKVENSMFEFCTILLLRKNFVKLRDFIKSAPDKDKAREYIIFLKYLLSMVPPGMLKVLQVLAVEFDNIRVKDSSSILGRRMYFSHRNSTFMIDTSAPRYRIRYDTHWMSSDNVEYWMIDKIAINGYELDSNEALQYLLPAILLGAKKIRSNQQELALDLNRRNGITSFIENYEQIDAPTDPEFVRRKHETKK